MSTSSLAINSHLWPGMPDVNPSSDVTSDVAKFLRQLPSKARRPLETTKVQSIASAPVSRKEFTWTASTVVDEILTPSQAIAEWHGQVIAIEETYFVAELRGTIGTGVAGILEEAQIPKDEVREDDLPLFQVGAFFRLCVNVEIRNKTRRRFTDIIFRRMPAYRREELEQARQDALELVRGLRLE